MLVMMVALRQQALPRPPFYISLRREEKESQGQFTLPFENWKHQCLDRVIYDKCHCAPAMVLTPQTLGGTQVHCVPGCHLRLEATPFPQSMAAWSSEKKKKKINGVHCGLEC